MSLLMFPALILVVLFLTRAWHGDWKSAIVCLLLALGCVYVACREADVVPVRREAIETARRTEELRRQGKKSNGSSNQAVGADAPQPEH